MLPIYASHSATLRLRVSNRIPVWLVRLLESCRCVHPHGKRSIVGLCCFKGQCVVMFECVHGGTLDRCVDVVFDKSAAGCFWTGLISSRV